jgi:hypothetical protein
MVSRVKKSVASSPVARARRKVRHPVSLRRGAGPAVRRPESAGSCPRPRGAQPGQFSLEASVSPGRIVVCQAQHQGSDLVITRGPAGPVGIGPTLGDQAAVPSQQGGRGDESMVTHRTGQQPGQSGQDRSVWPGQARPVT